MDHPAPVLRSGQRRPARVVPFLVLTVLLALALAGCRTVEELADDAVDAVTGPAVPEEVHYVALGDSIAAGTAADTSYVTAFATWFAEETGAEVTVDNAAVPGWTVDDLLGALRDDVTLRTTIEQAHLVTFNVGGNDLLRALRLVVEGRCGGGDGQACVRDAVADLLERWEDLLDELLALTDGDVDRLRTMDLYPPSALDRLPDPLRTSLLEQLDQVNAELRAAAESVGVPVAAVHDAFVTEEGEVPDPALVGRDGIHPTREGHERIAAALAELGTEVGTEAPTDAA
jgi:lysophospholipase L1-like esterase